MRAAVGAGNACLGRTQSSSGLGDSGNTCYARPGRKLGEYALRLTHDDLPSVVAADKSVGGEANGCRQGGCARKTRGRVEVAQELAAFAPRHEQANKQAEMAE